MGLSRSFVYASSMFRMAVGCILRLDADGLNWETGDRRQTFSLMP